MVNLDPVFNVISSIPSALTFEEIVAGFAEKLTGLFHVDSCTVFRYRAEPAVIVVLADYVAENIATPFGEVSHVGATYPLGHYPTMAQVLLDQVPLVVYRDNPAIDEAQKTLLEMLAWAGVLMVPMVWRGQSVGLINLYVARKRQPQFNDNDGPVCQILANQLAAVIENARLQQEVEDGQLISEAMQVIGRALSSELDYQRIVRNVADFAYRLVNAQFVYVAVPQQDVFHLVATAGYSNQDMPLDSPAEVGLSLLEQNPLTRAVDEKRPIVVADIRDEPPATAWKKEAENQGWQALVATPLLSHNRLVGVLAAYADRPHAFNASDVATLMSLASQAAVAIHNAQLFAELESQREVLHRVSLRLVNAQEEERRHISRELHDELGQALTALKINLDVARRSLTPDMPEKLNQSVNEASSLAVQTLESARNLSLELHPAILDDLGLVSALRWEIDRYERRTDQTVQFKADLSDVELKPELEITIYRIVIEALTNIARHARATAITVQVGAEHEQVVVEIADDGVGFDVGAWVTSPNERRSLGLVGMRERAGLLGGELEVISQSGHGTRVVARLPWGD
jgi:signal transduction histidine kinase